MLAAWSATFGDGRGDLQRNAQTRFGEPGLLDEREEALVHFYRYLANQLVISTDSTGTTDSTGSIGSIGS